MKNLLNFHAKRTQITVSLICMLMGFFLVTQLRGTESYSSRLSEQSEEDLGQIIRDLNFETETLRSEVADARIKLYKYEGETSSRKTILSEAAQDRDNFKILAGLTAVSGQGIEITVSDKNKLLNGSDLLSIIEELRAGGAEAIALNNDRIVASAALERKKKSVYLNARRLSSPYKIRAVGDSTILYQAVSLPGGIRDALGSLEGVSFKVTRKFQLQIPACEEIPTYHYATAVLESD